MPLTNNAIPLRIATIQKDITGRATTIASPTINNVIALKHLQPV